ncbi:MAG: ATP-binding protein [Candidatus Hermodarchaeota archaeon]
MLKSFIETETINLTEPLQTIINHINYIIIELDLYGKIIYMNAHANNMLGYNQKELLGINYLKFIHPEDQSNLMHKMKTLLQQGGSISGGFRILHKDGHHIQLSVNGTVLREKESIKLIAILQDISQQNKLKEKNIELEKVNFLKNEFLSRASHELKTPLAAISGNAQLALMLTDTNLNPKLKIIIEEIQNKCEQLNRIINKLIASSKLETSNIQLDTTREDLSSLIKICVNEVQTLVKIRNLTIKLDLRNPIITKFNKEQIHEVIVIILTNAINYSPPGGIIEIKTKVKGNFIVISIKDEGVGFTEDEKRKIFQKFVRIERKTKDFDELVKGSGLGLYIAKSILERHGVEIWVESKGRNNGSKFRFTLPIA